MNKAIRRISLLLLIILSLFTAATVSASARDNYMAEINSETGFAAVLVDQAKLLDAAEEAEVFEKLKEVAQAGATAIFVASDKQHSENVVDYAKNVLEDICRTIDRDEYYTVVFVIDMYSRELAMYSGETLANTLTRSIADTITDNVYRYAGKAEYKECAVSAFEQVRRLLSGQKIAQPMRFITAALLAFFAGLAITLLIVRSKLKRREAGYEDIMQSLLVRKITPTITKTLLKEEKRVRPQVTYSSGSPGRSFGNHYSGGSHSSFGSSSHSSFGSSSHGSSFGSSSRSSSHSSSGGSRGSSGRGAGGSHRF